MKKNDFRDKWVLMVIVVLVVVLTGGILVAGIIG